MECPYINRDIRPNPAFNEREVCVSGGGTEYVYYIHRDGPKQYPCQFCQMIGRKNDIFECFNESEWQNCMYYLIRQSMDEGGDL